MSLYIKKASYLNEILSDFLQEYVYQNCNVSKFLQRCRSFTVTVLSPLPNFGVNFFHPNRTLFIVPLILNLSTGFNLTINASKTEIQSI